MKNIKLIVTDLDNTLLRRDKTISTYTVDVLRRVQAGGVLVAFATARDFRFVLDHISPKFGLAPDIVIADNGALARHKGNDIYKRMVLVGTVNALLGRFEPARCASTEKAYYISGDYLNDHWSKGNKATKLTDFSNHVGEDAFYLDGNTDMPTQSLTEGFPDVRAVRYSDVNLVTIVHKEASKLNALVAAGHALGIGAGNMAAFGDDFSDIEILSHCGYGVATANAIDECKAAAGYVCGDCDEDGVAKWVEENML